MGHLAGQGITVIGAGIGGLTAAIALARRGAEVTILERAPELAEIGAGIQLSPNGMRVIDALGLGQAVRAASLPSLAVELNDQWARPVIRLDFRARRPDADFRVIHRARLIECLARAAGQAGVTLKLGQPAGVIPAAGLVIGADGLHSVTRQALNGREVPFFTGQTAWRAVIPDDGTGPTTARLYMAPGRHLVSYRLAHGLRNIVAVLERRDWQDEGWSQPGDPQAMRDAFAALKGPVPDWLARVETAHLWGLFRHDVARIWQDGRIALVGDAAHPTLPFLAQGGVMAIEDAWTLASCLDAGPDPATALARYQGLRDPRCRRIVAAANANARNYHLSGARRLIGHSALRAIGHLAPKLMPSRFDWLYDHDPTAETP